MHFESQAKQPEKVTAAVIFRCLAITGAVGAVLSIGAGDYTGVISQQSQAHGRVLQITTEAEKAVGQLSGCVWGSHGTCPAPVAQEVVQAKEKLSKIIDVTAGLSSSKTLQAASRQAVRLYAESISCHVQSQKRLDLNRRIQFSTQSPEPTPFATERKSCDDITARASAVLVSA